MKLILCLLLSSSLPIIAATKIRLHDSPSTIAGYKAMDLSLGPPQLAQVTSVTNTTSSGTSIQATKTGGGTALAWISEPLAAGFTLSGTVTCNDYAKEQATGNNATIQCQLYKYSGSEGSSIFSANFSSELTTSIAVKNWTGSPTSTAYATGDRVVLKIFVINSGTMGAGTPGVTIDYDGPTDAADGSSWVQLNETVTFTADGGAGGTPLIIQVVSTPNVANGGQTMAAGSNVKVQLPRLTGSGNYIGLAFQYQNGTGWSVSDDGSNTYTLGPICTDAGQLSQVAYYYAQNVAASTHTITVTHSTGTAAWFGATAFEATNIATASSLDASSANCPAAAMTTVTAGSLTPITSGDLLFQFFSNTLHGNSGTGITVGSQSNITWALAVQNRYDGMGAQTGTYTSTSAINPTFTQQAVGSSQNTMSLAVALKPSIAGTAKPTGIQLAAIHTTSTSTSDASPYTIQVPVTGNLLALMFSAGSNDQISSITSSPDISAKCTLGTYHPSTNAHNGAQHFYCQNVTPGSYTFTITQNNNPVAADATLMWHDISGAATVAYDTDVSTRGVQTGTGDTTGAAITPSTSNGLILADIPVDFDTVISTTTSGALLTNGFLSSNTTGNTVYYNNNGNASMLNSNTSTVTFVWHYMTGLGADVGDWVSTAIAFKAPSTAGAHSMTLLGVGN